MTAKKVRMNTTSFDVYLYLEHIFIKYSNSNLCRVVFFYAYNVVSKLISTSSLYRIFI